MIQPVLRNDANPMVRTRTSETADFKNVSLIALTETCLWGPLSPGHEKCTKIHMGKRCVRQYLDKSRIPAPGLQNLSSIEEASVLCTTEYETIPGESGGPLMQKLPSGKWAVVGIVSGVLKDDAKPSKDFVISRFTSTVGYFDWIKSIIDQ